MDIGGAMEKRKRQHPSVGRIFSTIEVLPMTEIDSIDLIRRALHATNVQILDKVNEKIVSLGSGYPSPVHLLGYYAFDEDTDMVI